MNKRGKIIVNVIDTGDGLLISDADIERYGLQYDKHYEGEFLPDGRYMITGHREPMTNHNNASETSGEAEIVKWLLKEVSLDLTDFDDVYNYVEEVNDLHPKVAETIKRLVAERDAALEEERITRSKFEYRLTAEHDRAEAAEKRTAELKVTLNRVSADRDRWYKAARLLEAERAHSEAAKGVNTQYAWALFHLGLSDDDDPEEFGRQLSDKIDGLEADLQQAMEALELAARYLEYGGFDMTKIDAALKGKQP